MPELPEVENVARGLRDKVVGKTISRVTLTAADLYRTGSRPVSWLKGGRIDGVDRIGKAIRVKVRVGRETRALVVHLGMTGQFAFREPGFRRADIPAHRHGRFLFDDKTELWYVDARRFGYFYAGAIDGLRAALNIGLDPFEIDDRDFRDGLAGRTAPIKSLLLNQKFIAGLGNIYVDELLFFARVNPLRPARSAHRKSGAIIASARSVLTASIENGGTTFRDYRRVDGSRGNFQGRLAVYGREGEACIVCGSRVRKIVLGGRGTHFCPKCQPVPRRP